MPIRIPRGQTDAVIERMIEALWPYEADHPRSEIDIYRQNRVSVRVRIIDPDLAGRSKVERSKAVWDYLDAMSDETVADLSTLILLTPEETKLSFANFEFEDSIPSGL